jgi:hypothetical protein
VGPVEGVFFFFNGSTSVVVPTMLLAGQPTVLFLAYAVRFIHHPDALDTAHLGRIGTRVLSQGVK